MTTSTLLPRPASQAQVSYIKNLVEERDLERDLLQSVEAKAAREAALAVHADLGFLPLTTATALITYLKAAPRKAAAPRADVPEGMHKTHEGIFKVQVAVHGSGRRYAKRLVVSVQGEVQGFEYAPGALRGLSADTLMSLDEAKAFGSLYGVCCVCAAVLTDEESIARGIGPVCATKF